MACDKFTNVKVGDKIIASYSTDWENPHMTIVTVTKVYKLYFVVAFKNGNTTEYNFRGDVRGGSKDVWAVTRRQSLTEYSGEIQIKVHEVIQRKRIAIAFKKCIDELKLSELSEDTLINLLQAVNKVELRPVATESGK